MTSPTTPEEMTASPTVVDLRLTTKINNITEDELRRAMGSGIKNDQGKLRWDLLPLRPIQKAVEVLTFQLDEYGEDNWQRIERPTDRFYAALMRHIAAWRMGEELDPKTKMPHLAHALVNVIFLLWHTSRKLGEK